MAKVLLKEKPYEPFSPTHPNAGFAPGITVTLHMPASKRKIPNIRALLDTGAPETYIYPRCTSINILSDVHYDNDTGKILVGVEVEGQIYYTQCRYIDHDSPGSEHMLIGMDLMSNWLIELHGRRSLLSITHLEPDE